MVREVSGVYLMSGQTAKLVVELVLHRIFSKSYGLPLY